MSQSPQILAALKTLKDFERTKATTTNLIKKIVTDPSIPLGQRWELFIKSNLGESEYGILDFKSLEVLGDYIYADLDRYSTISMERLFKLVCDMKYGSEHEKLHAITSFQEEVLQKFIREFTYDW